MIRKLLHAALACLTLAFGLVWSGEIAPSRLTDLMSQAEAIIGRPLTPMSYAGVARRTAVRAGAYAAAVAPHCVTTYNSYGQPSATACN